MMPNRPPGHAKSSQQTTQSRPALTRGSSERAVVAVGVDQTPELPLRQLERYQRKRCIDPGAGFDQSLQAGLRGGVEWGKAHAGRCDELGHGFTADGLAA